MAIKIHGGNQKGVNISSCGLFALTFMLLSSEFPFYSFPGNFPTYEFSTECLLKPFLCSTSHQWMKCFIVNSNKERVLAPSALSWSITFELKLSSKSAKEQTSVNAHSLAFYASEYLHTNTLQRAKWLP